MPIFPPGIALLMAHLVFQSSPLAQVLQNRDRIWMRGGCRQPSMLRSVDRVFFDPSCAPCGLWGWHTTTLPKSMGLNWSWRKDKWVCIVYQTCMSNKGWERNNRSEIMLMHPGHALNVSGLQVSLSCFKLKHLKHHSVCVLFVFWD